MKFFWNAWICSRIAWINDEFGILKKTDVKKETEQTK